MSRFTRTTVTLLKEERGAALRFLLLFGCLAFAFFSLAGSYVLTVLEVLERVASRLTL